MSKLFTIVSSLLVLSCSIFQKGDLKDFKWKSRVLIINESKKEGMSLKIQTDYFEELKDRDLVLVKVINNDVYLNGSLTSNDMTKSILSIVKNELNTYDMILIGKDGKIKHRYYFDDGVKIIFKDIDSMPMRIREMYE
tara:strand:- start:1050 stop:1463 length:414 start_codon:yes stop_codon:yes gene_type:complete